MSIILTSGLFSFILIGLDVLVEKNIVDENNTGRKRSLILTSSNIAFVVGPLISGVFINYSINLIWLIGAIVFVFFSVSYYFSYKKIPEIKYTEKIKLHILSSLKKI